MAHRGLAIAAAVLFGLFALVGGAVLIGTIPRSSCPSGEKVAGAGQYANVPAGDCVFPSGAPSTVYDEGPAPVEYTGPGWRVFRVAAGAEVTWTVGMMLLAAAVAALPGRPSPATSHAAPPGRLVQCLQCGRPVPEPALAAHVAAEHPARR